MPGHAPRGQVLDELAEAAIAQALEQQRPLGDGLQIGLIVDQLGVTLPEDRDFTTVAGFALSVLKHLPETGETFRHDGWKFEIVDMDGRKIDKLIASRPRRKAAGAEAGAAG